MESQKKESINKHVMWKDTISDGLVPFNQFHENTEERSH